jgi:hypothetical protein
MAVVAVGLVAALQLANPGSLAAVNGQASSGPCSPAPCLNLQGYTLWVSNVTDDGGVLKMRVKFRNSSNSTHATPEDLTLVDAQHRTSPSVQDPPGCTHWGRTEFNNGASYGPITVCFRPASLESPLTLHWTPDMGFFCCDALLRIR